MRGASQRRLEIRAPFGHHLPAARPPRSFRRCDAPSRVIAPQTGRERLVALWRSGKRILSSPFFTGPTAGQVNSCPSGGKSRPSALLKLASGGLAGERCSGRHRDKAGREVILG